jgi:two-component system nitrogen regulation sensor histidine kinase GlnL
MGLALCDKIIRQHAGSIDFGSSPAGTEFSILLPMTKIASLAF